VFGVNQNVIYVQTADQVKRSRSGGRVKPGDENNHIAACRPAKAEGASGAAAVVAVGRRCGFEVRVEVDGPLSPGVRCEGRELGELCKADHGRPPWTSFGDGQEAEGPIGEERRARGV
jgi:hypothetical protein